MPFGDAFDINQSVPLEEDPFAFEATPIFDPNAQSPEPRINPEVAQTRAQRYAFGLQGDPGAPTIDSLRQSILAGDEKTERNGAVSRQGLMDIQLRQDILRQYIDSRGAGQPVTPEEQDFIMNMSPSQMAGLRTPAVKSTVDGTIVDNPLDPDTFFERKFAEKAVSTFSMMLDTHTLNEALQDDRTYRAMDDAQNAIQRTQLFTKIKEDVEAKFQNTSWGSTAWQFAEQFVPFMSWWNLKHTVNSNELVSSFLKGNAMEDIVRNLKQLPPKEAGDRASAMVNDLAEKNIFDAIALSNALLHFTSMEQFSDNVFAVADLAATPGTVVQSTRLVSKAMGALVRATSGTVTDITRAAEAAGNTDKAMKANLIQRFTNRADMTGNPQSFTDLGNIAMTIVDPGSVLNASRARTSREITDRVEKMMDANSVKMLSAIDNSIPVTRLEEKSNALQIAVNAAKEAFNSAFPHLQDMVIDIKHILSAESLNNVEGIQAKIGKLLKGNQKEVKFVMDTEGARPVAGFVTSDGATHYTRGISQTERIGKKGQGEGRSQATYFILDKDRQNLTDKATANPNTRLAPTDNADEVALFYTSNSKTKKESYRKGDIVPGSATPARTTPRTGLLPVSTWRNGRDIDISPPIKQLIEGQGPGPKSAEMVSITIGTPEASAFASQKEALIYSKIYNLKPGQFAIREDGTGFYITINKAVDETLPSVREALAIEQASNPASRGWGEYLATFGGKYNTLLADRLFSHGLNLERKQSLHGIQVLTGIVHDIMKNQIFNLRGESQARFNKFTNYQRDFIDGQVQGKYSNTLAEFEKDWHDMFKKLPSEEEISAYFAHRQVGEVDYLLTNLGIQRDKSRKGFENFGFRTKQFKYGDINLEGRVVTEIPNDKSAAPPMVALWDETEGLGKYSGKGKLTQKDINEAIANGYKIVHLAPDGQKNFREHIMFKANKTNAHPKADIDYVLVKDYTTQPLGFQQIPFQGGGHKHYIDSFFIAQPRVIGVADALGKNIANTYYNDINIHSVRSEQEARNYAKAYDQARILMNQGKDKELQVHLSKTLPFTVNDFKAKFNPNGGLDPNLPILPRPAGRSIGDSHDLGKLFQNLRNYKDSPHNAYNGEVNLRYATERNETLSTIVRDGSANQPLFRLEPSRLLDPMSSMVRSIESLARSRYFDDLKVKSLEEYLAKFGDLLQSDNKNDFFTNPMKNLLDPKWLDGANPERLAAAKMYRRATLEFLGMRDPEIKSLEIARNKLMNSVMDKFGVKAYDYIDKIGMHREKDPVKAARSAALHLSQGLFNPTAFFQQAQAVVNAAALTSIPNSLKAYRDSYLMKMLKYNDTPATIAHYAKLSENSHFLESFNALRASGKMNVSTDMSIAGDIFDMRPVTSTSGKFLDAGLGFMKSGESFARLIAWNSAYNTWRSANPTAKLTPAVIKEILGRVDIMMTSMSKASNAQWQTGVMSVPTQFFGFHARFAEQMLGVNKALSSEDRARLFLANSLVYGIPVTLGGAFLWPVQDSVRKSLVEGNGRQDFTGVDRLIENGLPSMLAQAIGGEEYAFGERLGPGGMNIFRDILFNKEESKALALFGGVSGRAFGKIWSAKDPFIHAMIGTVNGDKYPLKTADFIDVIQTASAGSAWAKTLGIMAGHGYMTKDGRKIDDTSSWSAFNIGILGVEPTKVADMRAMINSQKELDEAQRAYKKEAIQNYRYGFKATSVVDSNDYFKRAQANLEAGMFRPDERLKIMREAADTYSSMVDQVRMRFIQQNPQRLQSYTGNK